MFNFLKRLKSLASATAEEAAIALRAEKTGLHAFDEMMEQLPIVENEFGTLKIGEMHAGEFNTVLRCGDLEEIFKLQEVNIPYTSVDEKMFRDTMSNLAEFRSKNIEVLAESSKKAYPQLNIFIKDAEELSEASERDIKKIEEKAASKLGTKVKVALFIGVATLSAGWMIENLRARRGCHMITVIDNHATSCKVQAHTCLPEVTARGVVVCNQAQIDDGQYFNVTLVLIHLANSDDNTDELKVKVCEAAGIEPQNMKTELANIIDKKYKTVRSVIMKHKKLITPFNPCTDVHKDVEKGELPICRMCSPSADPVSTQYIDPSQYADNVTFQCITNPSLLDVISDFTNTTGAVIIDGITSTLWALVKPILVIFGAVAVVLILVLIGITMYKNPSTREKPSTTAVATIAT